MAIAILQKVKIEGEVHDILAKSNQENVTVTYNNVSMTLAEALTKIFESISGLPTTTAMNTAISSAISELIGGAPETYDTLKEIADYIEKHKEVRVALDEAIGKKVDKVEGKGLSTEDFTTILKQKLENMAAVTEEEKNTWNAKASTVTATQSANGLMSKEDKVKLDNLRGVRYGDTVPDDMQNGELFVQFSAT